MRTTAEIASQADRWNRRYRAKSHSYGRAPSPFLVECMARLESDRHESRRGTGRALDVAMGEGRNALYLARLGLSVTGLDVSLVAARRAARIAVRESLPLDVAATDLDHWCVSSQAVFDLIVQFYFLERPLFPSLVAALRPGGYLALETFSTRHAEVSDFGPRNRSFLLAPGEVTELIGDLEPIVLEDQIVELDEGRHQGRAGLIRLLARKPSNTPEPNR